MKCQILFSGKNKKNISNVVFRVLSVEKVQLRDWSACDCVICLGHDISESLYSKSEH